MDNWEILQLTAGWTVLILIGLLGAIVLLKLYNGAIDLSHLISERDGQASLSRFQFLIFTFVIAMGLLLMILAKLKTGQIGFPDINSGVWGLLGISGGSYVISKGIHNKNGSPQAISNRPSTSTETPNGSDGAPTAKRA